MKLRLLIYSMILIATPLVGQTRTDTINHSDGTQTSITTSCWHANGESGCTSDVRDTTGSDNETRKWQYFFCKAQGMSKKEILMPPHGEISDACVAAFVGHELDHSYCWQNGHKFDDKRWTCKP